MFGPSPLRATVRWLAALAPLLAAAGEAEAARKNDDDGVELLQTAVEQASYFLRSGQPYRHVMENFGDAQYIAYFHLGGQELGAILDTGSFDLVVFPTKCWTCGQAKKFNPNESTSFHEGQLMSSQTYGSGETYSMESYDYLKVGGYPQVNQSFWAVLAASMPLLNNAAFQAIIGVGPPETPSADAWHYAELDIDEVSNFFEEGKPAPAEKMNKAADSVEVAAEVVKRATLIDTMGVKTFSVCIGALPGSDGYFVWNDDMHERQSTMFTQVPVVGKHTWGVQLFNPRLENGEGEDIAIDCTDGCSALPDSGTSLIAVPSAVYKHLAKQVELLDDKCSNIEVLPDIVFELGGIEIRLPPETYIAKVDGEVPKSLQSFVKVKAGATKNIGECELLVMELDSKTQFGAMWILGLPFFRKYYTTFAVGESTKQRSLFMAPASVDCQPSTHEASLSSTRTPLRAIDGTRLYVPPRVRRAIMSKYMRI